MAREAEVQAMFAIHELRNFEALDHCIAEFCAGNSMRKVDEMTSLAQWQQVIEVNSDRRVSVQPRIHSTLQETGN